MPRMISSIEHAGLARAVERVDDLRIDQSVQLGPDCRRLAGLGVLRLMGDQPKQVAPSAVTGEKDSFSSRSGRA